MSFRSKQDKQEKTKERRKFKQGLDSETTKTKRDDVSVELRKKKRAEQLAKRRKAPKSPIHDMQAKLQQLSQLVAAIQGDDSALQLEALTTVRRLVSVQQNPPIDTILATGILPRVVTILAKGSSDHQFEAAWILTNLSSGSSEHTKAVVDAGAIPILAQALQHSHVPIQEQCVWALGNVAGDQPAYRNGLLQAGIVQALVGLCKPGASAPLMRNVTWTMSNLCRGKNPPPDMAQMTLLIPYLVQLTAANDDEVVSDACWALSFLTDDDEIHGLEGKQRHVPQVVATGVVGHLVKLTGHRSMSIATPALRTMGNVVSGTDDAHTDMAVQAGLLDQAVHILQTSTDVQLRKELCWVISNVTAGTHAQINAVLQAKLVPTLIQIIKGPYPEVVKEAAFALANVCSEGTDSHVASMVQEGVVAAFCHLLDVADAKIVEIGLEGLDHILRRGAQHGDNPYTQSVEECQGLESLEALQRHANPDVYDKTVAILKAYFGADESMQDSGPAVSADANQFSFSVPTAAASGAGFAL